MDFQGFGCLGFVGVRVLGLKQWIFRRSGVGCTRRCVGGRGGGGGRNKPEMRSFDCLHLRGRLYRL